MDLSAADGVQGKGAIGRRTLASHVPQTDGCERDVGAQQEREHRGAMDEVLGEAGRQAADVRDGVEVKTGAPDHDLQHSRRAPKKCARCSTLVTFDAGYLPRPGDLVEMPIVVQQSKTVIIGAGGYQQIRGGQRYALPAAGPG